MEHQVGVVPVRRQTLMENTDIHLEIEKIKRQLSNYDKNMEYSSISMNWPKRRKQHQPKWKEKGLDMYLEKKIK